MKSLTALILTLLCWPHGVAAQDTPVDPFSLLNPYIMKSLDYYGGLRKLDSLESHFCKDDISLQTYFQAKATIYSFNGMMDSAIMAFDSRITKGVVMDEGRPKDTVDLSQYSIMSAKVYILDRADGKQAIIVNEAHHVPQHRIFVKSLLKDLYAKGYRYLGIEAAPQELIYYAYARQLIPSEIFAHGYYTRESCYAEVLREAARTGYMVYGYEPTEKISSFAERDSLQARNLYNLWDNDPNAKVLILAGYDHVNQNLPNSMCSALRRNYGISALTVNQAHLYEHATPYYESPFYTSFAEHFDFTTPSVLINHEGEIDNRGSKVADVMVYSPRVNYKSGRPDWLLEEGARRLIPVRTNKKTTVIKAYYAYEQVKCNEPSNLYVPIDQAITRNVPGAYNLALPQGLFLIQYLDSKNDVIRSYYKSVK